MQIQKHRFSLSKFILSVFIIMMFLPISSEARGYIGLNYGYGHGYGGYGGHHVYGYSGYRPYGYYGHRSHYYSPYRYRSTYRFYNTPRTYNAPQYENNNQESDYTSNQNRAAESNGWESLSHNQPETAQSIFASEAQNNPDSGIPKAGYAVASAALSNLDKGVWAMRRAFRIDPDSLHYISLDQGSLTIIDNLIPQYRDEAFMLSALNYLKHDYVAAHTAIDYAIKEGDGSESLRNLQRLVDEQLSDSDNHQ